MQSQTVRKPAVVSVNAAEALELPRHFYDASLLFRCMDMFQVDQRELATDDPLLFRELQGRCSLCPHKDDCARDLEQKFDNDRLDKWRAYCPNSAMLTKIGAIQNCGHAAQHLTMRQAMPWSEVG